MKIVTNSLILVFLLGGIASGNELPPKTENEKLNYSVGYQIGGDFRRQGVELDTEAMVRGIRDGQGGSAPKLDQKEMQKVLAVLKSKVTAAERQRKSAQYEADIKEGKSFLEANAKKEGVVSLPGGTQYREIRGGSGRSPAKTDNVVLHYTGTLANGSEFFTTRKAGKPQETMVGNLIPGMRDVVLRMKEGDRWLAFVPGELGYGGGNPLYGKTVVFDIELVQVRPEP